MLSNFLTMNSSLLVMEIGCVALKASPSVNHPFTKPKIDQSPFPELTSSHMINITEFGQIWRQSLTLALILPVQTHLCFLLLWDLRQTEKVVAEILIIFGLFFFSFWMRIIGNQSSFFFKEKKKKEQKPPNNKNKPPPKTQKNSQKLLLKSASQKVNLHPHSCRSKSLSHTKLWNASIPSKAIDTQTFIKPIWVIFLFLLQHVFIIHASFKSFLYAPCIWITSCG